MAISITNWTGIARVVRSEVLSIRENEFVEAARAAGAKTGWILIKHVIPNAVPAIIVLSTISVARVILMESSLSYLGLGIPPEIPGWGLMLAEAQTYIERAPWLGIWPGLAIMITALAINLAGDRLRDVLDPKTD